MQQWKQSKNPELKPVMAAYLNMARHNVYRTLMHISKQSQVYETITEEASIVNLNLWNKLCEGTGPEQLKIIKLLQKHFPFLQAVFDVEKKNNKDITVPASPKKITNFFTALCLPILNGLRNEYTHYRPEPRRTGQDKELLSYLYRALDGSAREIRNRYKITVNSSDKGAQEEKITAINTAVEYIFQGSFRKQKQNRTFIDKEDYFYALASTSNAPGNKHLSDIGIVYFTCLFLEKRYIAMFLDALKPWPPFFDQIQKKAVLEVFSVFCLRLPREKYDSTRPDYALGLDILNELQKCPKELFDILPTHRRDKLSVDIKAEGADVVQDDGVTVKDGKVQMRRVRDRFVPLALQYIDMQKSFSDLRFMVHLGSYRFQFYKKQCLADKGPDTLRILQKEINGFGRIDEIESERKKVYSSLFKKTVKKKNDKDIEVEELIPDTPDSSPYITNTKAHYLIANNRIGIRMDQPLYVPSLQERESGKSLVCANQIKLYAPQAWLSIYELPGLLFYMHLCKMYPKAIKNEDCAEVIIKSYIEAYQKLFENIKNGVFQEWDEHTYAPLSLGDLPVKIKSFIQEPDKRVNPFFAKKSQKRIIEMIDWTKQEIDSLKVKIAKMSDKENKFNKKGYVDVRPGTIAAKLTRDILFFTPPSDTKSKITSANFNSLQSALALSQITYSAVHGMVKNLQHPFIEDVFKAFKSQNDFRIFDFYQKYLEFRLNYLQTKQGLKKEDLEKLPFLHSNQVKWQTRDKNYIKDLAGRYLEDEFSHGFELPRSLFTTKVENLMCAVGIQLPKIEEDGRRRSMSNLINLYFSQVLKDDSQKFYNWERHYDVFDKLNGKTNRNNSLVHDFLKPEQLESKMSGRKTLRASDYMLKKAVNSLNQTLTENNKLNIHSKESLKNEQVAKLAEKMLKRAYADYDDNERLLRRFAVQDKILFLMAKNILLGIEGIKEEKLSKFKLKNILPGEKDSILELLVPFHIILQVDNITLTIKQKELVKIKRYGEFFRYSCDTRLRSLLRYLAKTETEGKLYVEVDRDLLEAELSAYDLRRITVMKMVQGMEQSLLNQADNAHIVVPSEVRQSFNALISKVGKIPYSAHGEILINIRNSFCHNEYAKDIVIPNGISLPRVAEMISNIFKTERKRKPTMVIENQ